MKKTPLTINFESTLHSIDTALCSRTKKDTYLIYIMIFSVIFSFTYLLFWENSVSEFERSRANIIRLQHKINSDNKFLQKNTSLQILNLDKEIQEIQQGIIIYTDNNAYIKTKLETVPSLMYNEKVWSKYIDSISENAQKYHVKIKKFSNRYLHDSRYFSPILDIFIASSADYKNTLLFINSIEESDLLIDIHSLNIKAQANLNTDFNISVWGISY